MKRKIVAFASDEPTERRVREAVVAAVAKNHGLLTTLDNPDIIGEIGSTVWQLLEEADLLVAHILHSKPNLLYEVGVAHGMRKPVILVTDASSSLPFDLHGNVIVRYDPGHFDLEQLLYQLEANITRALSPRTSVVSQLLPWLTRRILVPDEVTVMTYADVLNAEEGARRGIALEDWFNELARGVKEWDISAPEPTNRDTSLQRYDLVIWNRIQDADLNRLGNPVAVELKAVHRLSISELHWIASKAQTQGLPGIIVGTTAKVAPRSTELAKDFFRQSGFLLVILDDSDLSSIKTSKDLVSALKRQLIAFRDA